MTSEHIYAELEGNRYRCDLYARALRALHGADPVEIALAINGWLSIDDATELTRIITAAITRRRDAYTPRRTAKTIPPGEDDE